VAYKFARALMGTNKDFNMAKFITACGCDTGDHREGPQAVIVDTPINLIAGHDYVLMAETDDMADPVTLRGPGGEIVVTVPSWSELHGTEFRAPYTATYFIEHDETVRASVLCLTVMGT
jgi:hypothetical protein